MTTTKQTAKSDEPATETVAPAVEKLKAEDHHNIVMLMSMGVKSAPTNEVLQLASAAIVLAQKLKTVTEDATH